MKLLTKALENKLLKNNKANLACIEKDGNTVDLKPVVKLFTPDGSATWLLTEMDENGLAFGLCDMGFGSPELGYVSIYKVAAARGPLGLPIERDRWFTANKTLSDYAEDARNNGRIRRNGYLHETP